MITRRNALSLLASPLLVASAAGAQPINPVYAEIPSLLGAQASVTAFYSSYSVPPIWFKGGIGNPAATELARILRRAPFDGFSAGPQLALQVETAARLAASGRPADLTAAERTLSTAWVAYAQWMKSRTPGMIYAYHVLAPQGGRTDQILLSAAQSTSLLAHLNSVASPNPIYTQLREAAWSHAQATGNLTPDPRLILNLERARSLPGTGRFILVDAASQQLYMYENGQLVDSMKVVVGDKAKLGLPTPMIASVMHYMTFNPYWNVPHHLVRKSVAPGVLKEGPKYLKARGYEIMSDWTENAVVLSPSTVDWKAVAAGEKQIRVRQLPGPLNSMGKMKFPFPSGQDIYLHDTPTREYFARANRALSNGCVRLEAAPTLARWILGAEPTAPSADPEIRVRLPQGVPVYLTYLTAKPTPAGVAYLEDIYGWDVPGAQMADLGEAAAAR